MALGTIFKGFWPQVGSHLGTILEHLGVEVRVLVSTTAASKYSDLVGGFKSRHEVVRGAFRVVNFGGKMSWNKMFLQDKGGMEVVQIRFKGGKSEIFVVFERFCFVDCLGMFRFMLDGKNI